MRIVKKPDDRKKELIAAAIELFISYGYDKTTVDHIINKIGVAKGCFYHHYRSKENIFEDCIATMTQSIVQQYIAIFTDEKMTAKQKLLKYIDYNFMLAEKEHAEQLMIALHTETFLRIHDRVAKESVKKIMPYFVQLMEQGKSDSGFHIIDAEFTAISLMGAFLEVHGRYSQNPSGAREKQRELVLDLMERLLQISFVG